jgi:secretion/DNA translocation related CpaE-like protein
MAAVPPVTTSAVSDPDPESQRRPLVVTDSHSLLDDLLRLSDAAGVTIDVVADGNLARRYWADAPLVVVGSGAVRSCVAAALPPRRNVILIGDMDDGGIWDLATAVGAEHMIFLPEAEAWLVELFACAADPNRRHATVVGVVGGRGGAGATCLAVAVALAGMRRGLRTVLVDADPLGGGIDLALGVEYRRGPRWRDVAAAGGWTPHRLLSDALPNVDELTVLSWNRDGALFIPPSAMSMLLATARCGSDLIVVDLPRSLEESAVSALGMCQTVLLVVPAEVRASAAASRVREAAETFCPDIRVVVRVPGPGGLAPRAVAEAVGAPLWGVLRSENGLAQAMERGEPPGSRRRGPLARFGARFLTTIDFDAQGEAA